MVKTDQENIETYDFANDSVRIFTEPARFSEMNQLYVTAMQKAQLKEITIQQGLDGAKPQIDAILKEAS
jgi:hypothetical protein